MKKVANLDFCPMIEFLKILKIYFNENHISYLQQTGDQRLGSHNHQMIVISSGPISELNKTSAVVRISSLEGRHHPYFQEGKNVDFDLLNELINNKDLLDVSFGVSSGVYYSYDIHKKSFDNSCS